jgi:hypothetical protein
MIPQMKITSNTLDFMKLLFGFCLLLIIGFLIRGIAVNNVDERTSFGLRELILIIGMISTNFSQWAFGSRRESSDDKEKELDK